MLTERGAATLAQDLVMEVLELKSTGSMFTRDWVISTHVYSRNRRASEGDNWTEVGGGGGRAGKRAGGSR